MPANRYDLLCPDGLARAFRLFLGRDQQAPIFKAVAAAHALTVLAPVASVRPIMVSAVLRGLDFKQRPGLFKDFLNLQDKLHTNICRKRKLVSIGTHDLAKIKGPFTYTAKAPEEIVFVPLNRNWMTDEQKQKAINARDLFALLREKGDPCSSYLNLIEDFDKWPVLVDATGEVLSLPPILNGQYSAMSEETRDILIDVTAVDKTKAIIVLNTIIAMFSEFCAEKFSAECVTVTETNGSTNVYPDVSERSHLASVSYINSITGLKLSGDEICAQLAKMGLRSKFNAADNSIDVAVPITRSDIMHECDIAEDVAIAYGYGNLPRAVPNTICFGAQQELNKFTDLLRAEVARCLFSEVLTEVLISFEENFDKMQLPRDETCVVLAAPKSRDFEIGRTSLIPGLLKSLRTNRSASLPMRIFQIDDVMLRDSTAETGARNERRMAAAYCNRSAGLENVHGLVDKVFEVLSIVAPPGQLPYELRAAEDARFFGGRCVTLHHAGREVGIMGVVHPLVLEAFQLPNPVSLVELNLEVLESYRSH